MSSAAAAIWRLHRQRTYTPASSPIKELEGNRAPILHLVQRHVGKRKARLLGKPGLNREQEFANTLCPFRHKFCPFGVQSQPHFARSQHCCTAQTLEGISHHSKAIKKTLSTGNNWSVSTKKPPLFFRLSRNVVSQRLCCPISQWPEVREGRSAGPCQAVLFSSARSQCLGTAATCMTQS